MGRLALCRDLGTVALSDHRPARSTVDPPPRPSRVQVRGVLTRPRRLDDDPGGRTSCPVQTLSSRAQLPAGCPMSRAGGAVGNPRALVPTNWSAAAVRGATIVLSAASGHEVGSLTGACHRDELEASSMRGHGDGRDATHSTIGVLAPGGPAARVEQEARYTVLANDPPRGGKPHRQLDACGTPHELLDRSTSRTNIGLASSAARHLEASTVPSGLDPLRVWIASSTVTARTPSLMLAWSGGDRSPTHPVRGALPRDIGPVGERPANSSLRGYLLAQKGAGE